MYYYAEINIDTKVITGFVESEVEADLEEENWLVPVDAIDETWIKRKRWVEETQTWVDVLPTETSVQSSSQFTHFEANKTKHWLDVFVNDMAADVAALQTQVGDDSVSEQISDAVDGISFSVDANGVLSIG